MSMAKGWKVYTKRGKSLKNATIWKLVREEPSKTGWGDDKELGVGIGGKQIVFQQRSITF